MDGKSAMCLVLRSLFTFESAVCLHLSQLFVYNCIFCLFSNYLFTFCSKIKPNTGLDTLNFSVAYLLVYLKSAVCLHLSQLFVYFFAWHHTGAKTNILSRKLLAITRN